MFGGFLASATHAAPTDVEARMTRRTLAARFSAPLWRSVSDSMSDSPLFVAMARGSGRRKRTRAPISPHNCIQSVIRGAIPQKGGLRNMLCGLSLHGRARLRQAAGSPPATTGKTPDPYMCEMQATRAARLQPTTRTAPGALAAQGAALHRSFPALGYRHSVRSLGYACDR